MKHMLLACSALFLVPLLSGCCCCGSYTDPYGTPYSANYGECLPSAAGRPVSQGMNGNCSNCQGDNNTFSLPPLDSGVPTYSPTPTYAPVPAGAQTMSVQPVPGQPVYGQPICGPEVIGPEIVTGDAHYAPQAAPMGTPVPVAPVSPYSVNGTNALLPPTPIPAINTNSGGIPSPNAYPPASQPQAGNAGPMVPQVPPPPPEPVSQMRFRTYR
jgi:hypothetical protein